MNCDAAQSMLDRYVDAELPAADVAAFDAHLRACPACTAEALGRIKLKQRTRAAAAHYQPSPQFRARMQKVLQAKPRRRWSWLSALALASTVAVALFAFALFSLHRAQREQAFTELADLHVASLASANPVDVVSTDKHTVKPWFEGRIPFSFNPPELQGTDFTLAGGRVAYFQRTPAAQLEYGLRKHRLSVFIFQEPQGLARISLGQASASRFALQMETWSSGGLRYFIIGDAPSSDVRALARLFQQAAR